VGLVNFPMEANDGDINMGLGHALHLDPLADGLVISLSAPVTTDIAVPGDWICPSSHSIVSCSTGTGPSLLSSELSLADLSRMVHQASVRWFGECLSQDADNVVRWGVS
jgi:hypothetical protein